MFRSIRKHKLYPEENKASTLPALPLLHLAISCWQPSPFPSACPPTFLQWNLNPLTQLLFYVSCACLSLTHSLSPPSLWICLTLVLSLWAISYSVWWPADRKSMNKGSLVCLHMVSVYLKVRNIDDWWREWLQYICQLCSFFVRFFFCCQF